MQIDDWEQMCRSVTKEEIKQAIFSIHDDKSPGPDGYTNHFYKASWEIVGHDICAAVSDFF